MKKFAFAGLVVALFASSAMAEEPAKIVAECSTNGGKYLVVSLDEQRKQLVTSYGGELPNGPADHIWVKSTNSMFWNREYNASEKVEDIEMYANFDKEWVTVSVTDRGSEVLVTLKVDENEKITTLDSCKSITTLNMDDTVTRDMTWVSNNGEE
jgi:hypothetical protein